MSNRLASETSPYLQQHADNSVDWHPWGEEALRLARERQVPILLSIGYSACHWCHVMAHESFEDEETARVMNELFVNIKVDREERPDLDKIYQLAHQLLTQRPGGWPLTLFLTAERQIPFFGGTYFPKEPMHGLPAFKDLLRRVSEFYHANGDEVAEQGESMLRALDSVDRLRGEGESGSSRIVDLCRSQLGQQYDAVEGGLGQAPKFPHASAFERLLRHWYAHRQPEDHEALVMVTHSLEKMALGGVYDQLGGGFCRYSVDDYWMIPHFEKMLYDNGPLIGLYAELAAVTGRPLFRRIALESAEWVLREMRSPDGGFYSSLDADSEGEEGKFYVWTYEEVRSLLDAECFALFAKHYGLDRPANFEGVWHLHTHGPAEPDAAIAEQLDRARKILLEQRGQRIWPGLDDKVLTSWNALMIRGLVQAARHLEQPSLLAAAERASDFLYEQLWRDGRLLATYKDGRAHLMAYLDDYAFLLEALLALLELRWSSERLDWARALADCLLEHFEDKQEGGFFFTADDHEQLIQRPKPFVDESTPSGNAIAARALLRLGHLLGEPRYLAAAERTLRAAASSVAQSPASFSSLVSALDEARQPLIIVVLRGEGEPLERWHQRALHPFAPQRMVLALPSDAEGLPEAIALRRPQGSVVCYLCSGEQCSAPIIEWEEYLRVLGESESEAL